MITAAAATVQRFAMPARLRPAPPGSIPRTYHPPGCQANTVAGGRLSPRPSASNDRQRSGTANRLSRGAHAPASRGTSGTAAVLRVTGQRLPGDLRSSVLYTAGPAPIPGSGTGPPSRSDSSLDNGLKGQRSPEQGAQRALGGFPRA